MKRVPESGHGIYFTDLPQEIIEIDLMVTKHIESIY